MSVSQKLRQRVQCEDRHTSHQFHIKDPHTLVLPGGSIFTASLLRAAKINDTNQVLGYDVHSASHEDSVLLDLLVRSLLQG